MSYNHNFIRTRRKQLDLTQAELAKLLGFEGPGVVSQMEAGRRVPNARELEALRKALGLKDLQKFYQPVVLTGEGE